MITSTSSAGEEFTLPTEVDYKTEDNRLFAERNGVDLPKIVEAIKVRPTHSNMIFPGPGIGGYCLPKDGGLGVWSYHTLMGFEDDIFKITPMAIDINDTRALHVAGLVRDDAYQELEPEQIIAMIGKPAVIIDCFAMLSDIQIKTFFAASYEVKGLGRGHIKRLKEEVAEK